VATLELLPYNYKDGARPLFSPKSMKLHWQYYANEVNQFNKLAVRTYHYEPKLVEI
jgi:superoxide dismutase